MVEEYEREIKALEENKTIQGKLMIMSIYNEIFNHLKYSMSSYYRNCYEEFMRDCFFDVIKDVYTPQEFIDKYLARLKKNRLTKNVGGVWDNLTYFESMHDSLDEEMDYVLLIDRYDVPFNIKVKILVLLRNYINDVVGRTSKTFGDSIASKEIVNDVIDYLLVALESYMNDFMSHNIDPNYICNSLVEVLKMATKVVLTNKFISGEFSFELIENESLRNYFLSFKEMEQNVLLLGIVHGISGYGEDDHKEERLIEICKVLGISRAKYHLIITSLSFKKVALEKKQAKEKRKIKS